MVYPATLRFASRLAERVAAVVLAHYLLIALSR